MIMFRPEIGMKTKCCYLYGVNPIDSMGNKGVIENVGKDYFILRDEYLDIPYMVEINNYSVFSETDFSHENKDD